MRLELAAVRAARAEEFEQLRGETATLRRELEAARAARALEVALLRGDAAALASCSLPELTDLLKKNDAAGTAIREAVVRKVAAAQARGGGASSGDVATCSICMDEGNARDTRLNCGHVFCRVCAARLGECPMCCARVTKRDRVFL